MKPLRYTLVADGSSDAALMPVIEWLIAQHRPALGVIGEMANVGKVGLALADRLPVALKLYPCDILFVHRDAESEPLDMRLDEITVAIDALHDSYVPIIPVRMTEAWLFSDEAAIRSAAGNRQGRIALNLPVKKNWEIVKDPKKMLFDILKVASGQSGRALEKFNPGKQRAQITQRTQDFSRLRGLMSFDLFETELIKKLQGF